jgi:hypothetical protein
VTVVFTATDAQRRVDPDSHPGDDHHSGLSHERRDRRAAAAS